MNEITLTVGEEIFRFRNFSEWQNKARSWFRNKKISARDVICVDAKNRVCLTGSDFMRAKQEKAFPVRVFEASVF